MKSLSGSLKMEKIKSWNAIEQLLLVTSADHDTLVSKFHDRIVRIQEEHEINLHKNYSGQQLHGIQQSKNYQSIEAEA